MKPEEIASFAINKVVPLRDHIYGNRYRVAAHLTDGTYLPCVLLQSAQAFVRLALRRFKQLRWEPSEYEAVVEAFVASTSQVAHHELESLEISPYAWPIELLNTIHGETTMGWTAFVAEMKDGKMFSYGTAFNFEFFDLPEGYLHSDITKIHGGMVFTNIGRLEKFSMDTLKEIRPYRERPFFRCYLNTLDPSV